MIVKVKEPQSAEFPFLREGLVLFTYLHLAPDPVQADALLKSKCIAIAYETVTDSLVGLPLLSPMSQVADVCQFKWAQRHWKNHMVVAAFY